MKPGTRCIFAWFLGLAAMLAGAPAAHADWAVLKNGQRLHITGYERRGPVVILHLRGGETTLPDSAVLRFEPEDVFPSAVPVATAATGPYASVVAKAAKKNGLSRQLLSSVIRAESNFHPHAVSSKGALGLMQLMPATARSLAVQHPFDPAENVQAGAQYLKELLGRFRNVNLALAAYNAGPANVRLYHGIPPFRETHNYISRVRRDMKAKKTVVPDAKTGVVKLVCSPLETHCREEAVSKQEAAHIPLP
jgi:soluble lytic murein transglycosylase-like protein